MRKLLLKLLFRLLDDTSYLDIDDDKIVDWLGRQFQQTGFQDYCRKRDLQHLKTMGVGITNENYWIRMGQRLELLTLLNKVNEEYKKNKRSEKNKPKRK